MSKRLVAVLAVAAVASTLLISAADAGWYRKSRNIFDPAFNPMQVCRDGIKFALGTEFNIDPPPAVGTTTTEEVNLVRTSNGTPVLNFSSSTIPVIPLSQVPDPPGAPPDQTANVMAFAIFTQPWAGGLQLQPGENLNGDLGLLGGEPPTLITIPEGADDPIVVSDCLLFAPAAPQVDLSIIAEPNFIVPWLRIPVWFAVLSDPGFDATTIVPTSLKVGTSATTSGVKDVDGDGDLDRVGLWYPHRSGLRCRNTSIAVTGTTVGGRSVVTRGSLKTILCL